MVGYLTKHNTAEVLGQDQTKRSRSSFLTRSEPVKKQLIRELRCPAIEFDGFCFLPSTISSNCKSISVFRLSVSFTHLMTMQIFFVLFIATMVVALPQDSNTVSGISSESTESFFDDIDDIFVDSINPTEFSSSGGGLDSFDPSSESADPTNVFLDDTDDLFADSINSPDLVSGANELDFFESDASSCLSQNGQSWPWPILRARNKPCIPPDHSDINDHDGSEIIEKGRQLPPITNLDIQYPCLPGYPNHLCCSSDNAGQTIVENESIGPIYETLDNCQFSMC